MRSVPEHQFQSTPSGGKATCQRAISYIFCTTVSIHAFRGEGDADNGRTRQFALRFNPRLPGGRRHASPRRPRGTTSFNPRLPGGRRHTPRFVKPQFRGFQSTPSGGKATHYPVEYRDVATCFNPRLPGGRRLLRVYRGRRRAEFQSTPSGGKATRAAPQDAARRAVSIHAFRGEGDTTAVSVPDAAACFNPRLPGGRRR